jgi:hypothetical protein
MDSILNITEYIPIFNLTVERNGTDLFDDLSTAPASTTIAPTTVDPIVSKYEQCNYNLLFSHLPQTFQFINLNHFGFIHASLAAAVANAATTTTTRAPNNVNSVLEQQLKYQQQLTYKFCFSLIAMLFGLFYSLIGYRLLKLSTFIIGFALGSSIIYMILSEQKQLTLVETLIISLSIGVLFAFVALLVQYIGLFLLGVTSSITVVTFILVVVDLFYTNKSAWLCIGLLFLCATLIASLTLRFQKTFAILNTSSIGATLLLISLDFFIENNLLVDYVFELYKVNGNSFNMFERQRALLKSDADFRLIEQSDSTSSTTFSTPKSTKSQLINKYFNGIVNMTGSTGGPDGSNNGGSALGLFLHLYSSAHERLCWYTWLVFGSYFVFLFISLFVQFLITGKNYDHRDSWQRCKYLL